MQMAVQAAIKEKAAEKEDAENTAAEKEEKNNEV